MARELLICVALPAALLLGAEVVAQKTTTPQAQSQQRSDNQIAEEINSRLMASNALRPLDLGVWVHDGTATLSGTVPDSSLRTQADALVRSVSGVKSVDDQLAVGTVAAVAPGFPQKGQGTPSATANAASPNGSPSSGSEPDYKTYPNGRPQYGSPSGGPQNPASGPNYSTSNRAQNATPPRAYQTRPVEPLLTVPAQTPVYVMMMQTVDSHHTKPGMSFRGYVVKDIVMRDGIIAVPRGSLVEGTVIDARPPGHLKGRPQLALQLSNLNIDRTSYVLTTYMWAHEGPGKGGETASAVGGGAAFGAITGAIVGGGPVALLGAAIGGLGGAGLSALSSGPHLVVPAESVITFHLNAPLKVREPTVSEIHMLAANLPGNGPRRRRRYYSPPPIAGAPPGGYPY